MAFPEVVEATLQAIALSAVSGILAQVIEAHKNNEALAINWIPIFQFALFSLISTPPNFYWQVLLESTFPAHPPAPHPKKSDDPPPPPKLSIKNTVIKLVLDQTVGAVFNNLLFSVFFGAMRQAVLSPPRIANPYKAINYWTAPGTVDFGRVDFPGVWAASLEELTPLVVNSWKFWPVVSLVNFTLIKSVQGRNLVLGLAGIAWGTYMSLIVGV